jgi:hypothetical protein
MNRIVSKKGQSSSGFDASSSAFYWFMVLIPIVLVLFFFILLFGGYVDSLSPIPRTLEQDIVIARLTNTCFAKENSQGFLESNIIDISKVNKTVLEDCFSSKPQPSFSLVLKYTTFDNVLSHRLPLIMGSGGEKILHTQYVLVDNQTHQVSGILEVRFDE